MINNKDKNEAKKITSKSEDYSQWYLDIIHTADLAEHGPVRGSIIIKPYGYSIWERIQDILDKKIKETGVKNAYFPLFIPERFLNKEKKHVEGFSPEIAAVTYAGGKKLKEAFIIRPTSETIIYHTFAKWIKSHKDLPLLINQWVNVVRWEMRPRLFLRTTEFLWQEGHTVHEIAEEASNKAKEMLNIYEKFLQEYLAIPTIAGIKSESEKFAGADITYTLEAMMQDGKALQLATSHNLGQNFSKVFDIKFIDKDSATHYCYQTSWGLSTRVIGGLIMTHSDDKGLILPPKIAPIQVVFVPVYNNKKNIKLVNKEIDSLVNELNTKINIRIQVDKEDDTVGEKFYKWEKKGVPIRVELGPRDIKNKSVVVVRRDNNKKESVNLKELSQVIKNTLEDIQNSLYKKALEYRKSKTKEVKEWKEFVREINKQNFILAHWCGDNKIESKIKEETGATIRCIPFNQKVEKGKCIYSGKNSSKKVLFAQAY